MYFFFFFLQMYDRIGLDFTTEFTVASYCSTWSRLLITESKWTRLVEHRDMPFYFIELFNIFDNKIYNTYVFYFNFENKKKISINPFENY